MSGKLGKEWWWRLGRRTCEANFPCILPSSRRLTWRSNLDGWTSLLGGSNSWPRCNSSPHVVIYQLRNENNKKERNFRGIYQGSCATRLVRTGHPLLTFFMALISGGQAQSRRELLGFIKFGGLEIESEQEAGWCQNKRPPGKMTWAFKMGGWWGLFVLWWPTAELTPTWTGERNGVWYVREWWDPGREELPVEAPG